VCEWRQHLQPPRPFQLVRGFGLLPGCAAAPHYDRYGLNRWVGQVSRRYPRLRILGLTDRTALIGRDGDFTVVGQGSVTLVEGRRLTQVPRQASIELALAAS
jgi:cyanophycinase-like exopeptidase